MLGDVGRPRQPVVAFRAMPGTTLHPSGSGVATPRVARRWWSQAGSNRRPLACHASALPAELWPLNSEQRVLGDAPRNPEHSSGPISSLLVAADVANDIGDVLVAFFLVGDEGGIVIIIAFD